MTADTVIDEVSPTAAYELLTTTEGTALIDVRTEAEWDQIGVADISWFDGKIYVDQLEPDLKLSLKDDIELVKQGKPPRNEVVPGYRR